MSTLKKIHDTVMVFFYCGKCNFNTSGSIIPDKSKSGRWCPCCKSPLIWCDKCQKYKDGEKKDDKIFCGDCHEEIQPENYQFNFV